MEEIPLDSVQTGESGERLAILKDATERDNIDSFRMYVPHGFVFGEKNAVYVSIRNLF